MPAIARAALAVVLALVLLSPSAARAGTLDAIAIPAAFGTNGIAQAPDGSVIVAVERYDGGGLPLPSTVARIAPDGTLTQSPALGGLPTSVAIVNGKAWVSLSGTRRIAIVDPAQITAAPSFLTIPAGHCGPVAIVDGGNGKAYVSLPFVDPCAAAAEIAIVNYGNGSNAITYRSGKGSAYDLTVANGSLFVPDYDGAVVRRLTLDASDSLPQTAVYTTPNGASPDGIAIDPTGRVVTTLEGTAGAGRTLPTADNSALESFGANALKSPFGVATVGGSLFIASSATGGGTPSIFRYRGADVSTIAVPAGAAPWDVTAGPDGTVFVSDRSNGRVLRFTSRAPRATTGPIAGPNTGFVTLTGTVNPGGDETSARFEYGPTTAYGQQSTPSASSGTSDSGVTQLITGLQSGGTYHYRLVATNEEGTTNGEDRTFTLPVPPGTPPGTSGVPQPQPQPKPATPLLKTLPAFSVTRTSRYTRVTAIRLSGLLGAETITVTCKGRGCPKRTTETTRVKKAGTLTVGKRFKASKLRPGATLTVRVRRAGATGRQAVLTVRKGKAPKIVRLCLPASGAKAVACS